MIGVTCCMSSFDVNLKFNIIFLKTTVQGQRTFPITVQILAKCVTAQTQKQKYGRNF